MLKKLCRAVAGRGFRTLTVVLLGGVIAVPALAGNIYSWRTPSGDVAYTDDIKSVPVRYRDQVETLQTAPLGSYARFSAQDSAEALGYAERLQARLLHLQQFNASLDLRAAEASRATGQATIQLNGSPDQVLKLTGADSNEPVIVERVRVKRVGQIATRHDTVVRQGNRTLAIMRGNQEGEVGAVSGVLDEEDLEYYR